MSVAQVLDPKVNEVNGMGEVFDVVTGQEPSCIICGATWDCLHLVACIDITFSYCNGGILYDHIGELREFLEDAILTRIKSKCVSELRCTNTVIDEILTEAIQQYDPEYIDSVYIEEHLFLTFLIDTLIDSGAEEFEGGLVEEGGPGQSSAITLLYAEDPLQVILVARKVLENAVAKIQ